MFYELTDHFLVRADAEQTWAFFSHAENLPLITPPSLGFTVLTPRPIRIRDDSLLDYTIRWAGVPVRWRTRIIEWSPPRQFIDLQLRGPYTLWHHQHTFSPAPDGEPGTICRDRVIYKLPLGWMGRVTHALVVRRQLIDIFRYRRKVIAERLGWGRALQEDVEVKRV
jgi:hypothetical protein